MIVGERRGDIKNKRKDIEEKGVGRSVQEKGKKEGEGGGTLLN